MKTTSFRSSSSSASRDGAALGLRELSARRLPSRRCGRSPRRAGAPPARAGASRSSRAASSASIEGGSITCARSRDGSQRPPCRAISPSSRSIRTVSSMKSGLPSAASTIARAISARRRRRAGSRSARRPPSSRSDSSTIASRSPAALAEYGHVSVSSGREEQTTRIGAPPAELDQVLDEPQEGRLGPVEVVEEDRAPAAPARATRAGGGPPRRSPPAGEHVVEADRACEPRDDEARLRHAGQEREQLVARRVAGVARPRSPRAASA